MATGMGCKETATFRPATVTLSRREQAQGQQVGTTADPMEAVVIENCLPLFFEQMFVLQVPTAAHSCLPTICRRLKAQRASQPQ